MNSILYFLFGLLDIIAIYALILKMYRWPFWSNFKEIIISSLLLSLVSWIDRAILGIDSFDALIQYLLLILSLRYLFIVKWSTSFAVSTIGYLAFVTTQNIVYSLLLTTDLVSIFDAQVDSGAGTYLIQATNQLTDFIIAAVLYYGGYGFSYIPVPPHSIQYKEKSTPTQRVIGVINIIAALILSSTMYWIMNYHNHILIMVPSALVALVILVIISNKRDYER